ncbi:MAG: FAD:protein FMN transferase [Verrucomicrobia bacterium]|jgi:FAD:protein FMN transferase|nr:FAD:protein FMN transferase [Verrucomicrobiota bacterium]MBT7066866.1 FAD:protein FMN transferase [Verrucomicrobiota bacterium]MBT7701597.1 FAD:protein FMN transferase [Verrucomicrobiota bacterium]
MKHCLAIVALCLGTCWPGQAAVMVERQRDLGVMGTRLRIIALGEDAAALDQAIDAAVAEIRRVEDLMTDWRPSPLTQLNAQAGQPVTVPRELAAIISRAVALHNLTGGAFDPTFAAVGALWDFKAQPPQIPDKAAIHAALKRVGGDRVIVDGANNQVHLPTGMSVGLGGIAKGYGVDRAMAVLQTHGVRHALVDAGGDMKLLGTRHGKPWEVAVKHPRDREHALAVLHLSNSCIVTSGDYERFVEHAGTRYHHILDPRTGYPATGAMSATVVAYSAELADAVATALCVLGPVEGLKLVERQKRVEAVIVGMDGRVHVSTGLKSEVARAAARGYRP